MKGDFSKMTFAPDKNFLRVLMQQGRVQLDSDWNEQAAILLHYMQTLATDLIGPYAGPVDNLGFKIDLSNDKGNFTIGKGRYYVGGVLCENHADVTFLGQADYPLDTKTEGLTAGKAYMVYLDVWERHISYLEDDDIREKALNGIDTATRSKVIWQVKVKELAGGRAWQDAVGALTDDEVVSSEVCLRARVKPIEAEPDACCQHPDSKYRGAENQLYRIEIHHAGENPTFKWSRDNGAVVFPVTDITHDIAGKTITVELENLGRDQHLGLKANDWVELVDDVGVLKNIANPLCQVYAIDPIARTALLSGASPIIYDETKHPLLRRWDQKGNANDITEGIPIQFKAWLPIEAGIEVEFELHGSQLLRTGDYWLIPARTNTGEVEWPSRIDANGKTSPAAMRPHGVEHHYAPLAIITVGTGGTVTGASDYRCSFRPHSYGCQYSYYGRLGQGIGTGLLCPDEE